MRKSKNFKTIKHYSHLVSHHIGKKLFIQYNPTYSPHSWGIEIDGYPMFNQNLTSSEMIFYLRGLLQGADFLKGHNLCEN